jgi:flavin reductase (DIM6/NTAB) family NADH-FMN oxidoreductase RutF
MNVELTERVKAVHRTFPTGLTVVAGTEDGEPYGLAVNAFSSLCLEPAMVMTCVNKGSRSHARLNRAAHLGISILAADQLDVASVFASTLDDKFDHVAWHAGEFGTPLLDGATSTIEVLVERRLDVGTHTMLVGHILEASFTTKAPIIYHQSGFFDGGALSPAV